MAQKTGALIFDETADRYDIRFDVNDYYGGLHCGGGGRKPVNQPKGGLPHGTENRSFDF